MGETQLIRYHGNSGPVRCPGSWSQLYTDCETLGKALHLLGHLRMMGLDWSLLALTVYVYYTVQFSCVECD